MIPHSEALLLVFSVSLYGSRCAVSLNRNERAHFWASVDPEPATSSPWTSRSTEMDMTSPTDVLHSDGTSRDLEVDPSVDQNPYVTMEDHGLSRLPASRTPWIKTLTSTKIEPPSEIQNDEEGPQTEASDWPNFSKQGNMEQSFKSSSLATLQPFSSQAWSTKSKTPIAWNTETYTPQTPAETRFSTYQTLWKSSGATQTPYGRGTLDGTTLPRGLTDNLQPSEETKDLTDVPTDSLTEPTLNVTNPDPEREERKGVDQVKKDQNGQSTTTVIKVTETYPEAASSGDDKRKSSTLLDCSLFGTRICQSTDSSRNHASTNNTLPTPPPVYETTPLEALTPPLLVPLLTDWNAAMATWGLAWELQVYGLGCVFSLVAVLSLLSLMCLPLRWPSGCAHFSLLHLLQLLTGSSRALWLLYDPYGQKERLPIAWTRLLHEAAYPCITASFGLLLLLLTARSCTQLLSQNTLQRSTCLLAALVLLHIAIVMASMAILQLFPTLQVVPLLPPTAFVLMSSFLSFTYLLLYCCAHADVKHIYRLSESSPERPSCHASRCPFTEAQMWERAVRTGVFSALFLLACGSLRLYAMLNAGGLTGGVMVGLMPWPWWGFQLSCRVCETGVCLTLALVITHPLLCCGVPLSKSGGCSWLFKKPPTEGTTMAKPTILSSRCGWSLRPAEKLGLCEGIARRESESVPLYTLVELPHSEFDGLDLHYPSSPQHESCTQLSQTTKKSKVSHASSFASFDADSTADLRPPSPIDLRRSIDEALNSEALFQHSLFGSSRLSLSTRGPPDGQPCRGNSTEPSLYRTASCGNVDPATVPSRPRQWSTISGRPAHVSVHCSGLNSTQQSQSSLHKGSQSGQQLHRRYTTLGSTSSRGSVDVETTSHVDELAVQAEFINVCRQIDALSISSDTIDL
ncbi:proline-rich transmembrane protein 4 [Sinocyclocheilus anshuiensis]|uniref:proline-rich transmembrane protein 4 n=1 Tax=Sinocyclocheilus anshuiensis TaxID=1608454 RepID=UPI0007B8BDEE|nr:PREDICTED: proline-rich transmembrane protein 4-like [Sinocyclocheilus anshuiensis]